MIVTLSAGIVLRCACFGQDNVIFALEKLVSNMKLFSKFPEKFLKSFKEYPEKFPQVPRTINTKKTDCECFFLMSVQTCTKQQRQGVGKKSEYKNMTKILEDYYAKTMRWTSSSPKTHQV